jgi:hypothetical protein
MQTISSKGIPERNMNKVVTEQFKIFCGKEIKPEDWLWCKRCHRCYKAVEFRKLTANGEIFLLCHYKDCHGDLPLDSRPWNRLIRDNSDLPQAPIKGVVYDLASNKFSAKD